MSEVLGLLGQIAQASSVDEVWDLSLTCFRPLGFARATYGYTRFRHGNSIGDPDDALFLSSFPPDYSHLYFGGGLYARTAVYRWVRQNTGMCTWRWVEEEAASGKLTRAEADAMRINHAKGVRAGLTFSFPEPSPRSKGALGLAADQGLDHDDVDRIWAAEGPQIAAVANMMHLKIIQLPLVTRRRALTERQREVLEWVADGKTAQDIAQIMDISPAMVEKHLRLARAALDVETTAQAVAKGALLNRIFQRTQVPKPAAAVTEG